MKSSASSVQPNILVVTGPSGVGKDTVAHAVARFSRGRAEKVVTATTRKQAASEKNGREHWFLTTKQFLALKKKGGFFETSQFSGKWYGSPKSEFTRINERGHHPIVTLDIPGVRRFRKLFGRDALIVFLLPPSLARLEERLRTRGGRSRISQRLKTAHSEIALARTDAHLFDAVLVNQDGEADALGRELAKLLTAAPKSRTVRNTTTR